MCLFILLIICRFLKFIKCSPVALEQCTTRRGSRPFMLHLQYVCLTKSAVSIRRIESCSLKYLVSILAVFVGGHYEMDVFLIKQQDAALLRIYSISDAYFDHVRCGFRNNCWRTPLETTGLPELASQPRPQALLPLFDIARYC